MLRNIFLVVVLATVLITQVTESNGARILGVFTPPAPSHYFLGNKIMKELALRGHEVTMISSFKQKTPMKNYKDVTIEGFVDEIEEVKKSMFDDMDLPMHKMFVRFMNTTYWMSERALNAPNVINFLKSKQKFDLVILESFSNEAHVGFAHHFDAPLVVLSTIGANIMVNHYTKNPAPVSYCMQMFMHGKDTGRITYVDRLLNTLMTGFMELMYMVHHFPSQEKLMHQYFPDAPSIDQIIKERLSLVLVNSHPSISPALPSVPNMIEIGGYHVDEPKELPKDLKEYLDGAKEGFVLFSMGSNLKSTMLPAEKRNMIMSVFKKLPYKVLWKFEDENLPGKPDNVRIGKWLPQNDILAHPNLKLFITHGGLLSTTEAVYHGVPIVGIPVLGDQQANMKNAEKLGIGKAVDFMKLTYEDLWGAVNEVLTNKKYTINAKERSKVMRDRPMKPIDTAMFWVEYAVRNKNAKHLKTAAFDLEWWEVMNLDVYATLGAVLFLSIYIPIWILKKLCCSRKKKQYPQEQKKKRQ